MNQIIVNHGIKNRIKEDLNTTYPTIRAALYGITDTKLSQEIRALALELGGVEVPKNAN